MHFVKSVYFYQCPEYPMTQYIFLFTVAVGMCLGAFVLT